jgi:hypothetical protein
LSASEAKRERARLSGTAAVAWKSDLESDATLMNVSAETVAFRRCFVSACVPVPVRYKGGLAHDQTNKRTHGQTNK